MGRGFGSGGNGLGSGVGEGGTGSGAGGRGSGMLMFIPVSYPETQTRRHIGASFTEEEGLTRLPESGGHPFDATPSMCPR
jgi:hypothetical protein